MSGRTENPPRKLSPVDPPNVDPARLKMQKLSAASSSQLQDTTYAKVASLEIKVSPAESPLKELNIKLGIEAPDNLLEQLRGYVSNSALISQSQMRDTHSLVKGTSASLGTPGELIVKLATKLGIKVSEDQGEMIVAKPGILQAFNMGSLNPNWKASTDTERLAVSTLASLAHNIATFSELPVFFSAEDFAFLHCRFHYVRHIQKIAYNNSLSDYQNQLKIGSDKKLELVNLLKEFNTLAASNVFVDLIEKIIEKIVVSLTKSRDSYNDLLIINKSHLFPLSKSYEKGLPKVAKVSLSEKAKRSLAKNPKARILPEDKTTVLVSHRPSLETSGFLEDKEREELAKFNTKLNEVSRYIPETSLADAGARKKIIHVFIQALFAKVSNVNRVISRRKTGVHNLMVMKRSESKDAEVIQKIQNKVKFSSEEWNSAFKDYNKDDLKDALLQNFGTSSVKNLNMESFVRELAGFPPVNSQLVLTSESSDDSSSTKAPAARTTEMLE